MDARDRHPRPKRRDHGKSEYRYFAGDDDRRRGRGLHAARRPRLGMACLALVLVSLIGAGFVVYQRTQGGWSDRREWARTRIASTPGKQPHSVSCTAGPEVSSHSLGEGGFANLGEWMDRPREGRRARRTR